MLLEQEIIALKDKAVKLILSQESKTEKDRKLPEFNPVYIPSVEEARRIAVHADGDDPSTLFKKKAPNQSVEEFDYSLEIYKARTMAFWENMLGKVARIWNKNNFSVGEWDVPAGKQTFPPKEYFTVDYPQYKSIFSYFELVVTPFKMKDSNAVIAYRPLDIPKTETGEIDQTEPIEPIAIIYGSHQVLFFEDLFAFILLEEKSWVTLGSTKVKEGLIFEIYDDVNIWRLTQVGNKGDRPMRFKIELFFTHDLGYLPVKKLRGRPIQMEEEILYQSYMFPAIPSFDAIAVNYSNLDMSIYHSVYPHKWEYVEECDNPNCVDGQDRILERTCESCFGTGKRTLKSGATGVTQIKIPQNPSLDTPLDKIEVPPFGWVSPDVATLQFLREEIKEDTITAFSILNMKVSETVVKGSDTALGKMIDREELFSWLSTISGELFDCLIFSIETIGLMRYGETFQSPSITPPVNFSIRSADELIEELKVAVEAKLPTPALMKILKEFISKRFNQDEKLDNITELVFSADRLLMIPSDQINLKKDSILKWEIILHDSIFFFIDEAVEEDEKFLNKDIKDQIEILRNKAIEKASQLPTTTPRTAQELLEASNATSAQN